MTENNKIFYQVGKAYAVTINPCDALQMRNSKKDYFFKIKELNDNIRSYLKEKIRYKFYLDISQNIECHEKSYPRLHYHGIIFLEDNEAVMDWLVTILPRLSQVAYIKVGNLNDIKLWKRYCVKCSIMFPEFNSYFKPLTNKLSFQWLREFLVMKECHQTSDLITIKDYVDNEQGVNAEQSECE